MFSSHEKESEINKNFKNPGKDFKTAKFILMVNMTLDGETN